MFTLTIFTQVFNNLSRKDSIAYNRSWIEFSSLFFFFSLFTLVIKFISLIFLVNYVWRSNVYDENFYIKSNIGEEVKATWVVLTVDIEQSFRTERRANMPSQQRRFAWIQLVNVCQAIQMISPSLLRVEWFRCIVIFMAMKQKFARGNHASLSISPFWTFWCWLEIIGYSSQ